MYGVATQNGVGVSLGNIPALTSLSYPQMLNAIVLGAFSGGAPGWIYDDTNQSTLFQDAAGTTPVTALEQPVGLQLDLSQGLVLGSELVGDPTFANPGYWSVSAGWAIAGNAAVATASNAGVSKAGLLTIGKWYKATITVNVTSGSVYLPWDTSTAFDKAVSVSGTYTRYFLASGTTLVAAYAATTFTGSVSNVSCKQIAGNHRYQPTSANRPTWSARYNLLLATASLSTQSVTTVATNYVLYFTGAGTVTLSGTSTGTLSAGSNTITCTAGTLTLTVSGSVLTADLRPADQAVGRLPQYQRVNTATDYDANGFPAGLRWNGSNSSMQNASVDFSGTNKVSVFVGVRKQSASGGYPVIAELSVNSDSNAGTFELFGNASSGTHSYAAYLHGSSASTGYEPVTFTAPITNTISLALDMAGANRAAQVIPRINGVVNQTGAAGATSTGSQNFGNYPAYFGARAGSSLFFNGLTFSNVCIGIELSASQIAAFEAWTNSKARAY